MLESGRSFTSSAEMETVKDIKEKLCFVALDYETEFAAAQSSSELNKIYKLPDESMLEVKGTLRM